MGKTDCGCLVIPWAVHLAYSGNPQSVTLDKKQLHSHLETCLLTHYQMNYFSVEVTFSLYMNQTYHITSSVRVFSPQTSHKCSYSHPLHIHDSNHTHPLTSWQ